MHRTALSGCVLSVVLTACAPEGAGPAFISFNAEPDAMCVARADTDVAIPQGLFDIDAYKHDGCARSYVVNLVVNSNLRQNFNDEIGRVEPNILQIHSAEVKLTTIMDETIVFPLDENTKLPNPFLVTTNNTIEASSGGGVTTKGIATVEAIPAAYRKYLAGEDFVGSLIRARIQVFGRTTGDLDIETAAFTYPIEICSKCLSMNIKEIPDEMTIDDIIGGKCKIGGVDGRMCVFSDP